MRLAPQIALFLGRPQPCRAPEDPSGELPKQVRRLDVRARQAMRAGLLNRYQSAFRGRGLEFEQVREYQPGDDVRTVDWNVTARTGVLHVKEYREERDLRVLLLVDLSASTLFGSGVMTVHDLIVEVSSLFVLAAARRDRVGAILFDDHIRSVIPPREGARHGLRVVRELLAARPAGRGTAVTRALRAAGGVLHRRGVVLLVADRSCPLPARELVALRARHEVVVVRVGDELAERGALGISLPVIDVEAGRPTALSGPPPEPPTEVIEGIDVLELSTCGDYLDAVQGLLERRERRHAR